MIGISQLLETSELAASPSRHRLSYLPSSPANGTTANHLQLTLTSSSGTPVPPPNTPGIHDTPWALHCICFGGAGTNVPGGFCSNVIVQIVLLRRLYVEGDWPMGTRCISLEQS